MTTPDAQDITTPDPQNSLLIAENAISVGLYKKLQDNPDQFLTSTLPVLLKGFTEKSSDPHLQAIQDIVTTTNMRNQLSGRRRASSPDLTNIPPEVAIPEAPGGTAGSQFDEVMNRMSATQRAMVLQAGIRNVVAMLWQTSPKDSARATQALALWQALEPARVKKRSAIIRGQSESGPNQVSTRNSASPGRTSEFSSKMVIPGQAGTGRTVRTSGSRQLPTHPF